MHATVVVPGSKSLTNRTLVLSALGSSPSTISGALRSRDTDLMIGALQTLGLRIDGAGSELTVTGGIAPAPDARVDCGLAGTVLRFVPPLAGLGTASVEFDGDEQARARPIAPLLDALRTLGVDIAGDIFNDEDLAKILATKPKSVICTHMYEHVVDRDELTRRILRMIPQGGMFFITVPSNSSTSCGR